MTLNPLSKDLTMSSFTCVQKFLKYTLETVSRYRKSAVSVLRLAKRVQEQSTPEAHPKQNKISSTHNALGCPSLMFKLDHVLEQQQMQQAHS